MFYRAVSQRVDVARYSIILPERERERGEGQNKTQATIMTDISNLTIASCLPGSAYNKQIIHFDDHISLFLLPSDNKNKTT